MIISESVSDWQQSSFTYHHICHISDESFISVKGRNSSPVSDSALLSQLPILHVNLLLKAEQRSYIEQEFI